MPSSIEESIRLSDKAAVPAKQNRWPRHFGALLCIGVSGLFLYLAVRQTNLTEVRRALASIDSGWLVPMIMVALANFWLRAVRWTSMFPANARPTVRRAFSVFIIGTMTNNILPGRIGDVARAGMIGRLIPAIGTSGALATVVLEKVADGLVLLALLGLAFLIAPLPQWVAQTGAFGSLVFLGSLVLLLLVNAHGKASRNRSNAIAEESGFGKIFSVMQRLLQRFAVGLNALNSGRQVLVVTILSLVIWLLEFLFIFLSFLMFDLHLPFIAAVVTGVILAIGMMLPAAPGAIGTYQFFTVTGLQLYHVPDSQALAIAVFLNLFVFANSIVLGLIALSIKGMRWSLPVLPKYAPKSAK